MSTKSNRTWLITGSSSGFGARIAQSALEQGDNVMLTARDVSSLAGIVTRFPGRAAATRLDVTEKGAASAVIDEIEKRFGGLDVLVNNAGYGLIGAVEEVDPSEYRPLFETNVFGLIETTRAALPLMRRCRGGRIVQFSSTLGMMGRAAYGLYAASKFAVEGLSESLAGEVEPFGIAVIIVEPGAFRTDFLGRSISVASAHNPAYAQTSGLVRANAVKNDGNQPGDPDRGVAVLMEAISSERPPLRLALGADSYRNNRGKITAALADYDAWELAGADTDFRA